MSYRVILAVVVLGLAFGAATRARPQSADPPKGDQKHRDGLPQAHPEDIKALRAEVAGRRALVEIRRIEHEANEQALRALLLDIARDEWQAELKDEREMSAEDRHRGQIRGNKANEVKRKLEAVFMKNAEKLHVMTFDLADLEKRLTNAK